MKAGGGQTMKIGQMLRQWLIKLEWFSTLFPRIPVPIQQRINSTLQEKYPPPVHIPPPISERKDWERDGKRDWGRTWDREREYDRDRDREYDRGDRDYKVRIISHLFEKSYLKIHW